jgi:hypothetical protein
MLVVSVDDVGPAALARMRRDGVLATLTDDAAAAASPVPLPVARAIALRPWIPRRAAATGLAALWVYGLTQGALAPARVEVVVPRGAHPDPPVGIPHSRWSFTTHQAAYSRARPIAGLRIACPADAAAAALRTAPLGDAMAAAYDAVARGLVTHEELCTAVSGHQGVEGSQRMRDAWRAVQQALRSR